MDSTFTILREIVAGLSFCLALANVIPYVLAIRRGETKPSRPTYAIWSVVNIVTVASYIAAGATVTAWTGLAFVCTALIVFGFSIKHGIGGTSWTDRICLILAALAIILWVTTGDPAIALYTSILATMLGYIPTLVKLHKHPGTENLTSWALGVTAIALNVLIIPEWSLHIFLAPVAQLVGDLSVLVLILIQKRKGASATVGTSTLNKV